MTITQGKEKAATGTRAGTQALLLLSSPIHVHVLGALAEQSKSLTELRRFAGSPPPTTMRAHLRTLSRTGAVIQRRQNEFPGMLHYDLGDAGRDLLLVAAALREWLARSPVEPLRLGTPAAKSAIKALTEGWDTNMLRALAARPLSLTELDSLISSVSYPSLERRLATMRLAGQIEPAPSRGRSTPYAVTSWLRRAVAPLAAAARWEAVHLRSNAAPIGGRDAETAFLLAIPLLRLRKELCGVCRLAVEIGGGENHPMAGVMVDVRQGRVASCVSHLDGNPDAWAVGRPSAWLTAVIEQTTDQLELGGDRDLSCALLGGLHRALFKGGLDVEGVIREGLLK